MVMYETDWRNRYEVFRAIRDLFRENGWEIKLPVDFYNCQEVIDNCNFVQISGKEVSFGKGSVSVFDYDRQSFSPGLTTNEILATIWKNRYSSRFKIFREISNLR